VNYILAAFERGVDGVIVAGCLEGGCHYLEGNLRAKMRVRYANRLLAEAGLGDERVRMVNLAPDNPRSFAEALGDVIAKARELGA
jgi:coenzyme F420-reducing hydrogenase delta subunit